MNDIREKIESGERHYAAVTSKYFILNFLAQYLAMRRIEDKPFFYHLLCMDDTIYSVMSTLRLDRIALVHCEDFETQDLIRVKRDRTLAEYCWTIKPPFLLHLLESDASIPGITYMDSDLFPFASLDPVWEQLGECSVILYPHHFSPAHQFLETVAGRYNAGMLTFRNDENGRQTLRWYVDRVMEWCYHREEGGKLGDQKYLLSFADLFPGVEECRFWGIDIGPWSLIDRKAYVEGKKTFLIKTKGSKRITNFAADMQRWLKGRLGIGGYITFTVPPEAANVAARLHGSLRGLLRFRPFHSPRSEDCEVRVFHFHQYRLQKDLSYVPASSGYPCGRSVFGHIYEPYTRRMIEAYHLVKKHCPDFEISLS